MPLFLPTLVGLTCVRTFPTSVTAPVEGLEHGEVEYEMTREQYRAWPQVA
jgi:hypothetical protein